MRKTEINKPWFTATYQVMYIMIHDLEDLRKELKENSCFDQNAIKHFDYIIIHAICYTENNHEGCKKDMDCPYILQDMDNIQCLLDMNASNN
ncbi:MAG: hypothetical protein HRT89_10625 [Lentisphaeria bacterium]|nr:hypothetical protein [Lentisphaeria bacterium]NQZ68510.1 hypothetical protein [Lentisphaeria bacterium]